MDVPSCDTPYGLCTKQYWSLPGRYNAVWTKCLKDFRFSGSTEVRGVAMKFPEWFYCKLHTCILTAYWEGSPSKSSTWAPVHLAQRRWHCWKHVWNSCYGIAFSAAVTFLGGGGGALSAVGKAARRGVKLTTHLYLVPILRMRGAISPLLHMSSWRGA